MRADVAPFHHAHTGTWSYVVADPATRRAAIIDPVLDFDAKSGRTSPASVAGGREVACETTIGAQKRDNIHVRAETAESEFVTLRNARDATL
ncbi:MAG: hypothetical protein LH470_01560 [Lysobacter sp.]|nr:hypothetical protein [Lysobacter sp.]